MSGTISGGVTVNPQGSWIWTGGEVLLRGHTSASLVLAGGTEKLVSVGNNSANISGMGPIASISHVEVQFAGKLGGTIAPEGAQITISGTGKLNSAIDLIGNGGPFGGSFGKITLNVADHGPTISDRQVLGTLDFTRLSFLHGSTGVAFDDGFGPDGVGLPPGESPAFAAFGRLPTLEIDNLAPLRDIVLTHTDLTLDFTNGRSTTLKNVTVNDPKYFAAEQSTNCSLYLSETTLPMIAGSRSVPVTT
jgi:hypothetical protein